MSLLDQREERAHPLRNRVLAIAAAALIGAVSTGAAFMLTKTTYLTPALISERLIDCIGADEVVAQGEVTAVPPKVMVGEVFDGFESPTSVVTAPNGEFMVAERRGVITSLDLESGSREVIVDLSPVIDSTAEGGLLGMALHPDFDREKELRLFIVFTRVRDRALTIAHIKLRGDPEMAARSLQVMQIVPREDGWHAGGGVAFLPDGRLLVGVGDDSKPNEAQSKSNLLGKILAFNVDDQATGATIFSSGLRNPFRLSVDTARNTLWVADVGHFCIEEVNRVALSQAEGSNFGWPLFEGSREWPRYVSNEFGYGDGDKSLEDSEKITYVEPLTTYLHAEGGACAVIGGAVVGDWYLFADYCDGIVRAIPVDAASGTKAVEILDLHEQSMSIGVIGIMHDREGRTWVLDGWGGSLLRLNVTE